MDTLTKALQTATKQLYSTVIEPVINRTDPQFGDFSTNIAMQIAQKEGGKPHEIAQKIADELLTKNYQWLVSAQVAGPGFINVTLSDEALAALWSLEFPQVNTNKVIVVEYSDPNPFKALHAGHLYTTLVGNAIANLLESSGASTKRLNYGGDVGLHVAKAMYGILKKLGGENPDGLLSIETHERAEWISQCYVAGNTVYENDESQKQIIIDINKKVYEVHANNDTQTAFAQIYWTCRQWSYDGFTKLYIDLEVSPFNEFIPESKVTPIGTKLVDEGLQKGDFTQSDGAVIFDGESHGLHTRVFINSNGLPTYETKELGLASYKWQKYHFDTSVVITGNDIVEYMKVMLAAIATFEPEISNRTNHLTHGMIKLAGGEKMSSRQGNVLLASDIISAAKAANTDLSGNNDDRVAIGAIKYAFLRQRLGGDISYNPQESISLQGNSGPYIQYAHARARSILEKSTITHATDFSNLTADERSLVSSLADYQPTLKKAMAELMPHHICSYLFELSQVFNRFYENSTVIGDKRESLRLTLVKRYADTLKAGLSILGIEAPNKM